MRRLAQTTERPVTYGFVQHDIAPDDWKRLLDLAGEAADDGIPLRPQVTGRPVGLVLGLQTRHPLFHRPTFTALSRLPLDERVRRLRDPEIRARILSETPTVAQPDYYGMGLDRIFVLGDPPDYEPPPEMSVMGLRARAASTRWSSSTTCCSSATATSCSSVRCSGTATATSSRCARCSASQQRARHR